MLRSASRIVLVLALGLLGPGAARARLLAPPDPFGCADHEREGFRDRARYPDIAACAGGWDRPGVADDRPPHCERHGGDDGTNPVGENCDVTDLCAEGWHVCAGPAEVAARSPDGCVGAHDAAESFFVTRTSGPGCGVCATGEAPDCGGNDCRQGCAMSELTRNDVFGCGTIGAAPDATSCGALDRFSHDHCSMLPAPWACTDEGSGTHEASVMTKPGAEAGGALCCRDVSATAS